MADSSKIIGVNIDGDVEWHVIAVEGNADYDTLCGVDAHDPNIGHYGTTYAKRGQKITCEQCKGLWFGIQSLRLKKSNFV